MLKESEFARLGIGRVGDTAEISPGRRVRIVGTGLIIWRPTEFAAMLGVLITKIVRKDVRWGLVGAFGLIAFLLLRLARVGALLCHQSNPLLRT